MTTTQKSLIAAALVSAGAAATLWQSPEGADLPPYVLTLQQAGDGCELAELHHGIALATHPADCALADAGLPQVWDLSAGPWPCACRAGSDCESLQTADGGDAWGPAPASQYLPEGRWRGSDCAPSPCIEVAGSPALNPRCR